jgi:hypothetical protein
LRMCAAEALKGMVLDATLIQLHQWSLMRWDISLKQTGQEKILWRPQKI